MFNLPFKLNIFADFGYPKIQFQASDPSLGPSNDCADINECISGQNDCSENADCLNTEGSFRCQCHSGYR